MKYIIWGIGERLEKNIEKIKLDEVVCFVDKNAQKFTDGYRSKRVVLPDEIVKLDYDAVVISSNKYREEIGKELIFRLGISPDRILRMEDIYLDGDLLSDKIKLDEVRSLVMHYDRETYGKLFQDAGYHYLNADEIYANLSIDWNLRYRIYTVSHKKYTEINSPLYKTIWVGEAGKTDIEGIHDNEGENISDLNCLINECTALYWIWKNDKESDYIGLNHYRRFFSLSDNRGWPIQDRDLRIIMKGCEVAVCEAAILDKCIVDKLKDQICEEAFEAGYRAIKSIFDGKPAKEREVFERFIRGNVLYPRQMFVMRRELLNNYCSWLFPILFEMIKKVEIKDSWDMYSKRVIGFWAERMLTVWLLYTGYRIEELPVITTDDGVPYGMDSSGT